MRFMAQKVDPNIYQAQQLMSFYDMSVTKQTLLNAEKKGEIPPSERSARGRVNARIWHLHALPKIGERYGFLKHLAKPTAMTIFSMKGGVLKTTLAFNIARIAALHNIKTCVIGLDMQGDISNLLGLDTEPEPDSNTDVEELLSAEPRPGLFEFFEAKGRVTLDDIIYKLPELPTLCAISESPTLAHLDLGLVPRTQREMWLKKTVIAPLRERFELIIMDCPPNWTTVVSNAVSAADVVISPLETRINHFRNHVTFIKFLDTFCRELSINPLRLYVPTRFSSTRKLSVEIRSRYTSRLTTACTSTSVRESQAGEDAMAAGLSIPEFAPTSAVGSEMRDLMKEIWSRLPLVS